MRGRDAEVKAALQAPDEVRRSLTNQRMFLFYRGAGDMTWVCAIVKQDVSDGYLTNRVPYR